MEAGQLKPLLGVFASVPRSNHKLLVPVSSDRRNQVAAPLQRSSEGVQMFRIFKRRDAHSATTTPERLLIAEFEALEPVRRDAAALELHRLWSWFTEEFGGTASFLDQPLSEQDAYIDKLSNAAARSQSLKNSDLGRFYYSSAMLSLFMVSLRSGESTPDALAL
jgi:hypothetical protein